MTSNVTSLWKLELYCQKTVECALSNEVRHAKHKERQLNEFLIGSIFIVETNTKSLVVATFSVAVFPSESTTSKLSFFQPFVTSPSVIKMKAMFIVHKSCCNCLSLRYSGNTFVWIVTLFTRWKSLMMKLFKTSSPSFSALPAILSYLFNETADIVIEKSLYCQSLSDSTKSIPQPLQRRSCIPFLGRISPELDYNNEQNAPSFPQLWWIIIFFM